MGNGRIKVTGLGSASFDVNAVELPTVRATDGAVLPVKAKFKDMNRDGRQDLVLWFTERYIWEVGSTELCVSAEMHSGIAVTGCDDVRLR